MQKSLKDKKVLLVGLGILGGGVATANFLLENGANLTITDLKKENELSASLDLLIGPVNLVLGEHQEEDFKKNDIIVFNSSVSCKSPWVALAREENKQVENDYTLFCSCLQNQGEEIAIAITGTRGKTTVTHWINHLIQNSIIGGNIPNNGLLDIIHNKDKKKDFVLELSSSQLEYIYDKSIAPRIAVITNIYTDHLNRYKDLNEYMDAKSNIFANQSSEDYLILNKDNRYTEYFLSKKPKSKIYYISLNELPENLDGLFINKSNEIIFQDQGGREKIDVISEFMPEHKKSNLLTALLATYLHTKNWENILNRLDSLPEIPMRQQIIYNDEKIVVVNDSASTIPEATIAAVDSFSQKDRNVVLITGGTDKNLDFSELAVKIKTDIEKNNLFLLKGSGTAKLLEELKKIDYFENSENIETYGSFEEIANSIKLNHQKKCAIIFSPGAASFELFKNEFDRGEKFNIIIKNKFN